MRNLSTKPGLATVAIVAIVVGVLVAGGAAAYVLTDGFGSGDETQTSQTDADNQQSQDTEPAESEDVSLLRQALAGGDEIRCDYSSDGGDGVAYITSERQLRVDYTHPESGDGYFIKDGQNIYIWTDEENSGIMFTTDAFDEQYEEQYDVFDPAEFESETEGTTEIDCERDNFDNDLLTPPADVEFQDFSQLQQSFQQ